MKFKIFNKLTILHLLWIFILLTNCKHNIQINEQCLKYSNELYSDLAIDTTTKREISELQSYLLKSFNDSSIYGINNEAYLLQFYSSMGYGESVKFEKGNERCIITVKCKSNQGNPECKDFQTWISMEEWNVLEKMIYEFDFWTAEDFRVNKNFFDAEVYLLEGNRPEALKCGKKNYKLVTRGSPEYDKIGALCKYILAYVDQLEFRYKQK